MPRHPVDVFFYGSYINFEVLAEVNILERPHQVAWLPGYKLVISPLANMVPDPSSTAFGMMTQLDHDELDRLYGEHARKRLGEIYLPEAVLVYTGANVMRPALTYIAHDMAPARPAPDYVDRILRPAQGYGFPSDYLAYIESFKP
ncbi:MAG: hypothetical protein ETSY1_18335 [Candidatus Entotheonella factor]|uniref:Gamma-glutamylcyclotransferase AIG2-like domain-containing protein n=1 Tax=Entotheonella factor TaxID=1429438 RepID=W4LKN8_ENTF1|nr:gamma-glutamylcyclotransferase family protein [Candidatus Entotheonella palauensis]ETW98547.1 MAG: hypothetical protein ETSY1_18335 [Candidatus Entotheonella factor]